MGVLEQIARAIGLAENGVAVLDDGTRAIERAVAVLEERQRAARREAKARVRSAGRALLVPAALELRLARLARLATVKMGRPVSTLEILRLLVSLAEKSAAEAIHKERRS